MKEQFISYETALLAKEKGYDDLCRLFYDKDGGICGHPENMGKNSTSNFKSFMCSAPEQFELSKWLREQHGIHLYADWYWHESDGYVYTFDLSYVPKEFEDAKRRVSHVIRINSYSAYDAVYDGGFDTFEQALEAGLQKALTLIR